MKTYYIYHIPTVKIGCTVTINHRMQEQGFTDWEILEEHTDIYVASNREIELQKEYGLPVDTIPYWKSIENRRRGGRIGGRISKPTLSKEDCSRGGRIGGKTGGKINGAKNLTHEGRVKSGRKEANLIHTCTYCNKTGKGPTMRRWHFDNCKHKKTLTN